mgnify:CR=1 FL=1
MTGEQEAGERRGPGERAGPIVAIDGPAGVGKTSVARAVAARLGFRYVNTGAMYRAVAYEALRRRIAPDDAPALAAIARRLAIDFREGSHGQRVLLAGEDVTEALQSPAVSEAASLVSAHPEVRQALVVLQRRLAGDGRVVVEGRDIGTVVFPDAEVKVFLTASPEERARRRYRELRAKGIEVAYEDLRAAEEARDERDRRRPHSPLRAAPDAVVIDTTERELEEVVEAVLRLCQERLRVV